MPLQTLGNYSPLSTPAAGVTSSQSRRVSKIVGRGEYIPLPLLQQRGSLGCHHTPPTTRVRKFRFLGQSSSPRGEYSTHSILKKMKVPYQGSRRKVFEQTYSQQTNIKEQKGKLENLFSILNLKISFIGFVIVPVMCILCFLQF